jgi:hypothetical protein
MPDKLRLARAVDWQVLSPGTTRRYIRHVHGMTEESTACKQPLELWRYSWQCQMSFATRAVRQCRYRVLVFVFRLSALVDSTDRVLFYAIFGRFWRRDNRTRDNLKAHH